MQNCAAGLFGGVRVILKAYKIMFVRFEFANGRNTGESETAAQTSNKQPTLPYAEAGLLCILCMICLLYGGEALDRQ